MDEVLLWMMWGKNEVSEGHWHVLYLYEDVIHHQMRLKDMSADLCPVSQRKRTLIQNKHRFEYKSLKADVDIFCLWEIIGGYLCNPLFHPGLPLSVYNTGVIKLSLAKISNRSYHSNRPQQMSLIKLEILTSKGVSITV